MKEQEQGFVYDQVIEACAAALLTACALKEPNDLDDAVLRAQTVTAQVALRIAGQLAEAVEADDVIEGVRWEVEESEPECPTCGAPLTRDPLRPAGIVYCPQGHTFDLRK